MSHHPSTILFDLLIVLFFITAAVPEPGTTFIVLLAFMVMFAGILTMVGAHQVKRSHMA
jgi:hypothetical protein